MNCIIIFVSTLCSLAVAAAPSLHVETGFGRVHLEAREFDFPKSELENIETEILVDEELARVVTGNEALILDIAVGDLKAFDHDTLLERLKQRLLEKTPPARSAPPPQAESEEDDFFSHPGAAFRSYQWHFEDFSPPSTFFSLDWLFWLLSLFWLILALLFSAVAFYFAPHFHQRIHDDLKHQFAPSVGWGALAGALFFPLLGALAISLVGIPFIPLLASLYFTSLAFGFSHFGWLCGQWVMQSLPGLKVKSPWGQTACGLILITLGLQIGSGRWLIAGLVALGTLAGTGAFLRQLWVRFSGRSPAPTGPSGL